MGGIHDGHRERIRKQHLREGFSEHMPPHKMLEMILFYPVPRRDTNALAHTLLDTFGSYAGVFDAPVEALVQVPGISENAAFLIKLIMPAARMYLSDRSSSGTMLGGRVAAAEYLSRNFAGRTVETVFLLCMDNKGRVLACPKLAEGDEISVAVSARTVVEEALRAKATAVMIAHNHPMGFALPSPGDITVTQDISAALNHIHIRFVDHIIVSDGDFISMATSAEYAHIFKPGYVRAEEV